MKSFFSRLHDSTQTGHSKSASKEPYKLWTPTVNPEYDNAQPNVNPADVPTYLSTRQNVEKRSSSRPKPSHTPPIPSFEKYAPGNATAGPSSEKKPDLSSRVNANIPPTHDLRAPVQSTSKTTSTRHRDYTDAKYPPPPSVTRPSYSTRTYATHEHPTKSKHGNPRSESTPPALHEAWVPSNIASNSKQGNERGNEPAHLQETNEALFRYHSANEDNNADTDTGKRERDRNRHRERDRERPRDREKGREGEGDRREKYRQYPKDREVHPDRERDRIREKEREKEKDVVQRGREWDGDLARETEREREKKARDQDTAERGRERRGREREQQIQVDPAKDAEREARDREARRQLDVEKDAERAGRDRERDGQRQAEYAYRERERREREQRAEATRVTDRERRERRERDRAQRHLDHAKEVAREAERMRQFQRQADPLKVDREVERGRHQSERGRIERQSELANDFHRQADHAKAERDAERGREIQRQVDLVKSERDAERAREIQQQADSARAERDAERARQIQRHAEFAKAERDAAERVREIQRQTELAKAERDTERVREAQRQAEIARSERDAERAREVQRQADNAKAEREAERAREIQRHADLVKVERDTQQRYTELARAEHDVERTREIQRQADLARTEREAERVREAQRQAEVLRAERDAERAKEYQRQTDLAKAELAKAERAREIQRQSEIAKAQRDADYAKEIQRQNDAARAEREAERTREVERQADYARAEREAERAKEIQRPGDLPMAERDAQRAKEVQRHMELAKAEREMKAERDAERAKDVQRHMEVAKAEREAKPEREVERAKEVQRQTDLVRAAHEAEQRTREIHRQAEVEKAEREAERLKDRQRHADLVKAEVERAAEVQRQSELAAAERDADYVREAQRRMDLAHEAERIKEAERVRETQRRIDLAKAEREAERTKELQRLEREAERAKEAHRQAELARVERDAERAREIQRQADLARAQREAEERAREVQRQAELARQREAEARAKEVQRQADLARAQREAEEHAREVQRQAELARQREAEARAKEVQRQADLARAQREAEEHAREVQRQAELARQREAEARAKEIQRQADLARAQREAEQRAREIQQQADLARAEREAERAKEIQRQADIVKAEREAERVKEIQRQAEHEQAEREAERSREAQRQAEAARVERDAERAREIQRLAEVAKAEREAEREREAQRKIELIKERDGERARETQRQEAQRQVELAEQNDAQRRVEITRAAREAEQIKEVQRQADSPRSERVKESNRDAEMAKTEPELERDLQREAGREQEQRLVQLTKDVEQDKAKKDLLRERDQERQREWERRDRQREQDREMQRLKERDFDRKGNEFEHTANKGSPKRDNAQQDSRNENVGQDREYRKQKEVRANREFPRPRDRQRDQMRYRAEATDGEQDVKKHNAVAYADHDKRKESNSGWMSDNYASQGRKTPRTMTAIELKRPEGLDAPDGLAERGAGLSSYKKLPTDERAYVKTAQAYGAKAAEWGQQATPLNAHLSKALPGIPGSKFPNHSTPRNNQIQLPPRDNMVNNLPAPDRNPIESTPVINDANDTPTRREITRLKLYTPQEEPSLQPPEASQPTTQPPAMLFLQSNTNPDQYSRGYNIPQQNSPYLPRVPTHFPSSKHDQPPGLIAHDPSSSPHLPPPSRQERTQDPRIDAVKMDNVPPGATFDNRIISSVPGRESNVKATPEQLSNRDQVNLTQRAQGIPSLIHRNVNTSGSAPFAESTRADLTTVQPSTDSNIIRIPITQYYPAQHEAKLIPETANIRARFDTIAPDPSNEGATPFSHHIRADSLHRKFTTIQSTSLNDGNVIANIVHTPGPQGALDVAAIHSFARLPDSHIKPEMYVSRGAGQDSLANNMRSAPPHKNTDASHGAYAPSPIGGQTKVEAPQEGTANPQPSAHHPFLHRASYDAAEKLYKGENVHKTDVTRSPVFLWTNSKQDSPKDTPRHVATAGISRPMESPHLAKVSKADSPRTHADVTDSFLGQPAQLAFEIPSHLGPKIGSSAPRVQEHVLASELNNASNNAYAAVSFHQLPPSQPPSNSYQENRSDFISRPRHPPMKTTVSQERQSPVKQNVNLPLNVQGQDTQRDKLLVDNTRDILGRNQDQVEKNVDPELPSLGFFSKNFSTALNKASEEQAVYIPISEERPSRIRDTRGSEYDQTYSQSKAGNFSSATRGLDMQVDRTQINRDPLKVERVHSRQPSAEQHGLDRTARPSKPQYSDTKKDFEYVGQVHHDGKIQHPILAELLSPPLPSQIPPTSTQLFPTSQTPQDSRQRTLSSSQPMLPPELKGRDHLSETPLTHARPQEPRQRTWSSSNANLELAKSRGLVSDAPPSPKGLSESVRPRTLSASNTNLPPSDVLKSREIQAERYTRQHSTMQRYPPELSKPFAEEAAESPFVRETRASRPSMVQTDLQQDPARPGSSTQRYQTEYSQRPARGQAREASAAHEARTPLLKPSLMQPVPFQEKEPPSVLTAVPTPSTSTQRYTPGPTPRMHIETVPPTESVQPSAMQWAPNPAQVKDVPLSYQADNTRQPSSQRYHESAQRSAPDQSHDPSTQYGARTPVVKASHIQFVPSSTYTRQGYPNTMVMPDPQTSRVASSNQTQQEPPTEPVMASRHSTSRTGPTEPMHSQDRRMGDIGLHLGQGSTSTNPPHRVYPQTSADSRYPNLPHISASQVAAVSMQQSSSRHHHSSSLPTSLPALATNQVSREDVPRSSTPAQTHHRGNSHQSVSLGPHVSTTSLRMRKDPSEETILLTPSSLARSMPLKPINSRQPITQASSAHVARQGGGFSNVAQKAGTSSQPPAHPYQVWHPTAPVDTPDSSPKRAPPPPEPSASNPAPRRHLPPPISIPVHIKDQRNPGHRVFTPFRYLTTKRNRAVSVASVEAQDGTATNTVVGSPTASMHSTAPIQPPPLRDPQRATEEWRNKEEAGARALAKAKRRRQRPGVVFDVAEEHPDDVKRRPRRVKTKGRSSSSRQPEPDAES